ncbi:MAG: GNAT family N-acetyltransferase [Chloroflexi bacterium]|nr:GNAT family N-acetyltransferase [Chloroflexota bacterium]
MTSEPIKIVGQQTILRDWISEDVESYGYWMKPGHRWLDFDGPYYSHLTEKEIPKSMAKLQGFIDRNEWDTPRRKLVIANKQTNKIMGTVNWYWVSKETNWLDTGIGIWDEAYWGQGIGFEAFGLWCDYLFSEMEEIVRLGAGTWSGNHGMMALAEKVGMREESCRRDARIVKSKYYDSMGYGILRREWENLYPNGFAHHLHNPPPRFHIQVWDKQHPRWQELLQFTAQLEQHRWATIKFDWQLSTHMLVALHDDKLVGFLRLIRQEIGADMERPSVTDNNSSLIEAKVMAFAVAEPYRNQGIGKRLQTAALREAKRLGCYQLRSYSNGNKHSNHHLKIDMGFGIHPHVRPDDNEGVYFVLPV